MVPFVPEANRVFVRIRDDGGVTRGSTSVAIRTQAPSIGGTYTGGGQYTQADCANPANDASLGIQASVDVDDLGGGAFAGEVDITFPVVSGLRVRATATGSLSPSAQVGGSLAFSSLVNGQVVSSRTGTFTGQLSGDALAVSFEGQVLSGETCRVSGFLAVNR